jgi:hypothetical protein
MGKRNKNFALKYFCSYLQVIFTCRKILHGASAFTSPRKEGVLWTFIALKNLSPRPGLNPRTLGPMASTLNNYTTEVTHWGGGGCQRCVALQMVDKKLVYTVISMR